MDYDGRYTKDQSLKCDCLLFGNFSSSSPSFPNKQHQSCVLPPVDLDDTLYPFTSGIAADIAKNIRGQYLPMSALLQQMSFTRWVTSCCLI